MLLKPNVAEVCGAQFIFMFISYYSPCSNMNRKVCYIFDENFIAQCDRIPAVIGRASLVHYLIEAYGLLSKLQLVQSALASYKDMKEFHSELYLDHLKTFSEVDDEYMATSQDEEYGIGYDCAPVSNMFELVSAIAGGSMTAAKCIVLGLADVAINWCGGWHHAQRHNAEGFCYVNDIVLAIHVLRRKFPKILYLDLDVHHGNGVEDAFNLSKSVFTLSFHKHEPGFYPGTGRLEDIGSLNAKGYSCNVPLHASYCDNTLEYVFEHVFPKVYTCFEPDAIVVQCGGDALAGDPHGGANLTINGYHYCIRKVLDMKKPTLLLGGGGYKHPNVARLWASITALVTNTSLDENIPEHTNWPSYGPDYTLSVTPSLARDMNTSDYLEKCINCIKEHLDRYFVNECKAEKESYLKINEKPTKQINKLLYTKTIDKIKKLDKSNEETDKEINVYEFTED